MTENPTRNLRMRAEGVATAESESHANEDRNGRIVTFYSYKGGTGRTMALANTAWILAANGFRVLTVDWDLEAPGLAKFFRPFLDQAALAGTTGMMDLITEYREEALREVDHAPAGTRTSPASTRTPSRSPGSSSRPAAAWTSSRRASRTGTTPRPWAGSTGTSSTSASTAASSSTRSSAT